MKNFIFAILALISTSAFSQKLVNFTTPNLDTLWMLEEQISRVTKITEGSNLEYFNQYGDFSSATIRERSDDTANVAATVVITFAGAAGSVDSITINGVEIMGGSVAFTTNIGTTVGLVEDSIDNYVSTPVNYTASNVGAVLTISAPAAFGDTANGYEVVIYTTTLTATCTGGTCEMAGGFTVVRNILTMTDRIFNIEDGAHALNADRVKVIKEKSAGAGSVIWYEKSKKQTIETTDTPAQITTAINAL